jgi:hypothetical protein
MVYWVYHYILYIIYITYVEVAFFDTLLWQVFLVRGLSTLVNRLANDR